MVLLLVQPTNICCETKVGPICSLGNPEARVSLIGIRERC